VVRRRFRKAGVRVNNKQDATGHVCDQIELGKEMLRDRGPAERGKQ